MAAAAPVRAHHRRPRVACGHERGQLRRCWCWPRGTFLGCRRCRARSGAHDVSSAGRERSRAAFACTAGSRAARSCSRVGGRRRRTPRRGSLRLSSRPQTTECARSAGRSGASRCGHPTGIRPATLAAELVPQALRLVAKPGADLDVVRRRRVEPQQRRRQAVELRRRVCPSILEGALARPPCGRRRP